MANIIEIATKAMQDLIKAGVDAISSKVDVNTSTRQASWGADAGTKIDIEEINTKVGLNTNGAGTTTVFARLNQIYTHLSTYLSSARAAKIDNLDVVISGRQADWGAVAATKTNIDAAKTNTDTLKTNVGSNSDASSATGSVHAKLKDIKSSIPAGSVKSVQRGITLMNSLTQNVTISSVDMSKTRVYVSHSIVSDQTRSYSGGDPAIALTSATSIKLFIATTAISIPWEVIEYY